MKFKIRVNVGRFVSFDVIELDFGIFFKLTPWCATRGLRPNKAGFFATVFDL